MQDLELDCVDLPLPPALLQDEFFDLDPCFYGKKRSHEEMSSVYSPVEEPWSFDDDTTVADEPSFEDLEPQLKKPCVRGRPTNPDEPCEHGPSMKSCQKCVYRQRIQKMLSNNENRCKLLRVLIFWSQNLANFGSLAVLLCLPCRDSGGVLRAHQVIGQRIAQFRIYQEEELQSMPEFSNTQAEEIVSSAFDTLKQASPPSIETIFVAKWIISQTWDDIDAKALLGDACFTLTERIASMWRDKMFCPGVADSPLIEHFDYWKGLVSTNKDGIHGVKFEGDSAVRAFRCTGFSPLQKGMCTHCAALRRHLQKEKSAYKSDQPGLKFALASLSPGFRAIFDRWKASPPSSTSSSTLPSEPSTSPTTPYTSSEEIYHQFEACNQAQDPIQASL